MLLKDLKAAHLKGLERNAVMPFNALSSTQLFSSMGKEKPHAKWRVRMSGERWRRSGTGRISANRTWDVPDQAVQVVDDPEQARNNSRAVIVMD